MPSIREVLRRVYRRVILPRLIDLAMRSPVATAERARLVPLAEGRVLDLGIGSGLNLPHYRAGVRRLVGVDPSREAWRLARRTGPHVEFVQARAEALPFVAGAFDHVVLTWTLCSVDDPAVALAEIRRVLTPGGRLLFVEHGAAPDAGVRRWQERLTPLWRRVAGGCRLDRDVARLVERAGFRLERRDAGYAPGPRIFAYFTRGVASPIAGR